MYDKLIQYFSDRYTELMRLSGTDNSKSIDWYDGSLAETKRSLEYIKRITNPSHQSEGERR